MVGHWASGHWAERGSVLFLTHILKFPPTKNFRPILPAYSGQLRLVLWFGMDADVLG